VLVRMRRPLARVVFWYNIFSLCGYSYVNILCHIDEGVKLFISPKTARVTPPEGCDIIAHISAFSAGKLFELKKYPKDANSKLEVIYLVFEEVSP
jgi:hypothetical protein